MGSFEIIKKNVKEQLEAQLSETNLLEDAYHSASSKRKVSKLPFKCKQIFLKKSNIIEGFTKKSA